MQICNYQELFFFEYLFWELNHNIPPYTLVRHARCAFFCTSDIVILLGQVAILHRFFFEKNQEMSLCCNFATITGRYYFPKEG